MRIRQTAIFFCDRMFRFTPGGLKNTPETVLRVRGVFFQTIQILPQ
jgi:hypothetical protein